jgi:hypothetical protein
MDGWMVRGGYRWDINSSGSSFFYFIFFSRFFFDRHQECRPPHFLSVVCHRQDFGFCFICFCCFDFSMEGKLKETRNISGKC